MGERIEIQVKVNGIRHVHEIESRMLLSDFLRHTLMLTGTHVGCEHGVCGACTIMLNGDSIRACLMFAVQADGCEIQTVEGLGSVEKMSALQDAFHACHALQCGFCTPGMLMTCKDMLQKYPLQNDEQIRDGLSGNLCRCTGYTHIVEAVRVERDRRDAGHVGHLAESAL